MCPFVHSSPLTKDHLHSFSISLLQIQIMDTMYLKWNNYEKMIGATFRNLYEDDALTDITLCCTEGSVRAHKLVIATCSPYFRKIFKDHPDIRMAVMVKGVRLNELKILLEFMYKGCLQVAPDKIDGLAHLADELGVEGFRSSVDVEFMDGGSNVDDDKHSFFRKLNMFVNVKVSNNEQFNWKILWDICTGASRYRSKS